MITPEERQVLREVAQAATAGRWGVFGMTVLASTTESRDVDDATPVAQALTTDEHGRPRTWDADFIALADPPTVLALLDELEAVKRERDGARDRCEVLDAELDAAEAQLADADTELKDTDAQLTRLWELHEEYISENVEQRQEINRLRDRAEAAEGKLAKVREVVTALRQAAALMTVGRYGAQADALIAAVTTLDEALGEGA